MPYSYDKAAAVIQRSKQQPKKGAMVVHPLFFFRALFFACL